MKMRFKALRSLAVMVIFMAKISLASALDHPPIRFAASLAQGAQRPIPYSVMQFGMPGNEKFVFCRWQECQNKTAKHIALAEKPLTAPLRMPEPVVPDLSATPIATTDRSDSPKPQTGQRRLKKSVKKKTTKCEPSK